MYISAPAARAMRPAVSLVSIPPVPRLEPAPLAVSIRASVISRTSGTSRAAASLAGSAVYRPSISLRMIRASAWMIWVTMAERVSLSPTLISSVATVSFSFTTGMAPMPKRASKVLRTFRRLSGSSRLYRVSSTWPTVWLYSEKYLS